MTVLSVLDAAGRRRSAATLPGYHAGRPPRNKGIRYPADPPTVEEIVAVMRHTSDDRHGWRGRAMIVVLWRAGLRIQEALALAEHDLDPRRGSVLVRYGKGGRPARSGMDEWGWEHLRPWLKRATRTAGRAAVLHHRRPDPRPAVVGRRRTQRVPPARRSRLRQAAVRAAPAARHALELAREGVPLNIIQRQLGHANLGTTSIYLQGIDPRRSSRRAHTTRPDDVRQRRTPALNDPRSSGSVTRRFRSAPAK
jgi:integrase